MTLDGTDDRVATNTRPRTPEDSTREESYRCTRVPVDLGSTLLPDACASEEFFAIERERDFALVVDEMVGVDRVPPGDDEEMVQMFDSDHTDSSL